MDPFDGVPKVRIFNFCFVGFHVPSFWQEIPIVDQYYVKLLNFLFTYDLSNTAHAPLGSLFVLEIEIEHRDKIQKNITHIASTLLQTN